MCSADFYNIFRIFTITVLVRELRRVRPSLEDTTVIWKKNPSLRQGLVLQYLRTEWGKWSGKEDRQQ